MSQHTAIRTFNCSPGTSHLKSWLVETSADGQSWREISREEGNKQLNGTWFIDIFQVAGGRECHFIRLVSIDRNHEWYDNNVISAWEIFGSPVD